MSTPDHELSNSREIVVVDDTLDSLQLLTNILEKHGYKVRPVSSASLALETVAARLPDLILLDVKMPDMDGYEVCRRLKSNKQSRDIPVIFISAFGDTTKKVKGFEAGGVDYITKPYDAQEVLARVGTHLRLWELTEHLERQVSQQTAKLRASEKRYSEIVEGTDNLITEVDAQGRFIFVNESARKVFGLPPEECVGKSAFDFIHPDDREMTYQNFSHWIKEKKPSVTFENRQMSRSGKVTDMLWTINLHFDDNGNITSIKSIARDITERKKADDAYRTSLSRFEELFNKAAIPLCFVNKENSTLHFNTRFEKTFGYSREEIPTLEEWWQLAYPDPNYRKWVLDTCLQELERALKTNTDIEPIEYRVTCKNGDIRLMVVFGSFIGDDLLLTFFDITDRERTEEELREREERLQLAVDASQMGQWDWDMVSGEVVWSKQCLALYGLPPDTTMTYERFLQALHPEDREHTDAALRRAVEERGSYDELKRAVWPDGTIHWTASRGRVYCDAGGQPVRMIGVTFDITKWKEAEEELKRYRDHLEELVNERTTELAEAKEAAEAANQSKSDFLARMSHEIRTPLNAAMGLTNIVLKSGLTTRQRDYLNKAQIASGNLLEVINDILDFSKVEAGRLDLAHVPFDLSEVFEQLADLFSNRTVQKDLELIFALKPDVPRQLAGDPGRLTQVLTNLVENAIKFTDRGEIVVWAEPDGHADKQTGRTALKFRVSDTGIGIASDIQPALFEPFTQAEGYLSRRHEGSGLGLAICQRLVELMGGRIWVESTPGQGSTFFFTALFEAREEKKHPLRAPADLRGLKTLVVDDSPMARQMLSDLLESFTFDVSTADCGEKALEELLRVAGDPYKLVLLDWKMPGIDGIRTAEAIHSDPNIHHPPVIILVTAYGLELMQKQIDTAAVDTLLLKPVQASRLFNKIMELFGKKEAMVPRPAQKPKIRPARRLAGRRVLVVEDSELNLLVAAALLEELGLTVETAENGREALDKVTGSEPGYYDALLMDIQMPIMDGYEATKNIRDFEKQNAATSDQPGKVIPIIALTAHALKGEKEKCLEAGMDDYIPKPVDENDLQRVLLKWVAPRQQEADISNLLKTQGQSAAPALLDVQSALKHLGGKKPVYIRILKTFGTQCGRAHETIRRSLDADDYKTAERTAHTVKGAAGSIGAPALYEAAFNLEKTIFNRGQDIDALLDCFKKELIMAIEAVSGFLTAEEKFNKS